MPATPTPVTLGTNPAPQPALPATPAARNWAGLLAEVPGNAALWGAQFHGAEVAEAGVEGGDTWECRSGRWYRYNGYTLSPVEGDDVPRDVRVLGWPGKEHRRRELSGKVDAFAESEYLALARQAEELGDGPAFRDAAEKLLDENPYVMDLPLYARLVGADPAELAPAGESEVYDDEDRNSDR